MCVHLSMLGPFYSVSTQRWAKAEGQGKLGHISRGKLKLSDFAEKEENWNLWLFFFGSPGQWCLAWWCFGGAGQLAVMTWCCPPSSFFCCTASGELGSSWHYIFAARILVFFGFFWLHIFFLPSTQVGGSVRGPVRPSVWLRTVVFHHAGGPWPGLLGHPGQLPHLRERHHVAEHERQHSVHAAEGSGAVCHLHTAWWASASSPRVCRANRSRAREII